MPRLSQRYQLLLIIFVVLGLFYPAIFAGANSVDDVKMLQSLVDKNFDLSRYFRSSGFYYRPLLIHTYHLDQFLWGGAESFMHLENILLHCANAIFVYFLVLKFVHNFGGEDKFSPLLASLLFAVHPITTESVNWISGRTDLLATFFLLLSVLVLFTASQRRSLWLVLLSVALFICAIMSKEVMVFFLPMACLLLWKTAESRPQALRMMTVFVAPFLFFALVFVVARVLTVPASARGVDDLLAKWHYGFYDTFRVSFKVFGFYVKKMFIPVPLNFTIRQVSDLYNLFGLGVAILSVWLFLRHSKAFLPFLIAFFMTAPAILVALTSVAWTPIAERYIYLSVAFVAIGLAPLLLSFGRCLNRRVGIFLLALLLTSAATVTAHRNLIWQDNISLYQDTLEKSPDFSTLHNELGIALINQGRSDEADLQLQTGQNQPGRNSLLFVNQAGIKLSEGDVQEARAILLKVFKGKASSNFEVLRMLARVDEKRFSNETDETLRRVILDDLIDTYEVLWRRSGDSFYLYRCAQLILISGDKLRAAGYFSRVYTAAPANAYYKEAAGKLAARLIVP